MLYKYLEKSPALNSMKHISALNVLRNHNNKVHDAITFKIYNNNML